MNTDARPAADKRLIGALFVLAAVTCFAGSDTTSKVISVVPVAMVMWFRFITQAAVTAITQWPRQGRTLLATRHLGLNCLRGALLVTSSTSSYVSLRYLPMAEVTAIVMMTPILMTLVSVFVLREPLSRLRGALVVACFVGALLVANPGHEEWTPVMILPLFTLVVNTTYHVVTSRLSRLDSVGTMQFYTGCSGALLATIVLPFFWVPIHSGALWAGIALTCLLSTSGHWVLVMGYARAGIGTLTPLLYGQIAVSALLGWLVFSHVPHVIALVGICIIAVGGAACTWLATREKATAEAMAGRDLAALENASMEH